MEGIMSNEKWKASQYNHFVTTDDGNVLAFNAIACGLGQMDKKSYEIFQKIADGEIVDYSQVPQDLFDKLKQGNFIIPETREEIQKIKVDHYRTRFGSRNSSMVIIPTLECNFACDYCFEPGNPNASRIREKKSMTQEIQDGLVEVAKSIIPEGANFGITWYGGEPLLAIDVIEALTGKLKKICEEKKTKYGATVITNGYMFTPAVVKKLMDFHISFAQITIDGPEEIHNARRPLVGKEPTYEAIIDNLKSLPKDILFSISIRVNVDERNRAYIPQLLQDLKRHGLANKKQIGVYFSRVSAYTYSCNDVIDSCMMTREFATQELDFYREAMNLGFNIQHFPASQIGSCGAVRTGAFLVEPDGTLQACWSVVGRKDTSVGKIVDSSFQLNDNHPKWLSWSPFEKKNCQDCSTLPICMGGCPYQTLFQTEMAPAERGTCVPWKYNLKEMMKFFVEAKRLGLLVSSKKPQESGKVEAK